MQDFDVFAKKTEFLPKSEDEFTSQKIRKRRFMAFWYYLANRSS